MDNQHPISIEGPTDVESPTDVEPSAKPHSSVETPEEKEIRIAALRERKLRRKARYQDLIHRFEPTTVYSTRLLDIFRTDFDMEDKHIWTLMLTESWAEYVGKLEGSLYGPIDKALNVLFHEPQFITKPNSTVCPAVASTNEVRCHICIQTE